MVVCNAINKARGRNAYVVRQTCGGMKKVFLVNIKGLCGAQIQLIKQKGESIRFLPPKRP